MNAQILSTRVTPREMLVLVAAAVCLVAPRTLAQEGEEERMGWDYLETQYTLAPDFETPHTEWAKPYEGGALKVAFFTTWYQGSTDPREIVELMQRFDIDGHGVYFQGDWLVGDNRPDWYGGDPEAGTNRAMKFLTGPLDAIFVNQLTLGKLPERLRTAIRQRVSDGAGLVIVGEKAAAFDGATAMDPAPKGLPAGTYHTFSLGRIAVLPQRAKLAYCVGWETEFDYQMQEQGRALLWSAKRESRGVIEIHAPSVDRDALPSSAVQVASSNLPEGTEVRAVVRRWDGEKHDLGLVSASSAPVMVSLPKMRAGAYHIDCFATRDGRAQTWATTPFNVTSDRRVEAVDLDKDWAERNEKIEGFVRLSGEWRHGNWLELRIVDVRGRILSRTPLRPSGDRASLSFDIQPWMPSLARVEAALADADGEISSAYAYLRVTTRGRDRFNFVMWNYPSTDLGAYAVDSMVRNGVTAFLGGGKPDLFVAASGASYVPYAASFRASSHTLTAMLDPETGLLKSGCVHDPDAMRETIRRTVEGVQTARELGVFAYSLGDENAVRASCLGPKCLDAYRRYLKGVYGGIAALNREWGANYVSFDDIELMSAGPLPAPDAPPWFKEYFAKRDLLHRTDNEGAKGEALDKQIDYGNVNDEMRALQQGNFARWYDRQAFQCATYIEWCRQFQSAFKEIDPHALTGFEGTDSFTLRKQTTRSRQGGDLDAFVREMDYYGSYAGPANEVMRSIAPKGFPMGSWIGYTPDVEVLIFEYWEQIADRMNCVQWWRFDNLEGYNGYIAPNLAPFPAVKEIVEDTQVVRDGLGALLMRSDMLDDGIAMLYSMPSTHIAHFDGNDTYGLYQRDHGRWHKLLHDAGLQFRYVTDRMLRLGDFDASRYKVLLLPLAFAISPEEADVVRTFARNGGTVIADVRPALYDGHCRPLEQGSLNDVFGIKQTGNRAAREIDRMAIAGELNGQKLAMRWGNWHGKDIYPSMKVDPNVALTTGKGLGDAAFIHYWTGLSAPMCVVNEFGKGRAILLNFSTFDAPVAGLLRGLLAASGVTPAVNVVKPDGTTPKDLEISRWNNGGIGLLCLLGKDNGPATVTLPEPTCVYDLKARRYLGELQTFETSLRQNRASFFALLPKPAVEPTLSAPRSVRAGTVANVTVHVANAAGDHAIMVRVTDPAGRCADWMNESLIVGQKPVRMDLAFAYNDSPGIWELRAIDLYGNTTATEKVDLRPQ